MHNIYNGISNIKHKTFFVTKMTTGKLRPTPPKAPLPGRIGRTIGQLTGRIGRTIGTARQVSCWTTFTT